MPGLRRQELPEPDAPRGTPIGPDLSASYFLYDRGAYHDRKHESLRVEEHGGDVLEDIEFEPGTLTETDLTKSIAKHMVEVRHRWGELRPQVLLRWPWLQMRRVGELRWRRRCR